MKAKAAGGADVTYSAQQAAAWIINIFIDHLHGDDLAALRRMIAADLRYAHEQGRKASLIVSSPDDAGHRNLSESS